MYKMLSNQCILSDNCHTKIKADSLEHRNWIIFHLGESAAKYGFGDDKVFGLQFDMFSLGLILLQRIR